MGTHHSFLWSRRFTSTLAYAIKPSLKNGNRRSKTKTVAQTLSLARAGRSHVRQNILGPSQSSVFGQMQPGQAALFHISVAAKQ
eukprot:2406722-Pleurochrysis_carterae.AAC.1